MMIQTQKWNRHVRKLIMMRHGTATVQLSMYEDEFGPHDVTAEIYALCVNEEVRKQGYATALMDKAEEIARKNGHKAVYLYWSQLESPRWVLDWYYRRGYEAVGFSKHKIELNKKLV